MEYIARNFRLAVRRYLSSPGLALMISLTLALGIGVNVALFSVLNAVVLRPLPYGAPDRTVLLRAQIDGISENAITPDEYLFYRQEMLEFEGLAIVWTFKVNLTGGVDVEQVPAATVTAEFFEALGVEAAAGRLFGPDDFTDEGGTVVISHQLWQRRFGADPSILGGPLEMNGIVQTVIGVLPPKFQLPTDFALRRTTDVFFPNNHDDESIGPVEVSREGGLRGGRYGVALIRPGVTLNRVRANFQKLNAGLTEKGIYPREWNLATRAIPVADEVFGPARSVLLLLQAAASLVLLVACANVANLVLSGNSRRHTDMAVRAAFGAGRRDLLQELLIEGLVTAGVGCAAGVGLAHVAIGGLKTLQPAGLPRLTDASIDSGALAAAFVGLVISVLVSGLWPALRLSGRELSNRLASAQRGIASTSTARWTSGSLVVTQMALSVILVVSAALMMQSMRRLLSIDLGFHAKEVLTCKIFLPYVNYPVNEARVGFFEELVSRLETLGGVERAAVVRVLPLQSEITSWPVKIAESPSPNEGRVEGFWQVVSPGYFGIMDIPLIQGRVFDSRDHFHNSPVIVINEGFAQSHWPGQEPVGQSVRIGGSEDSSTIIGVVADVRHNGITAAPGVQWYVPYAQAQRFVRTPLEMTLVVSTNSDAETWSVPAREELRILDPNVPMAEIRTLEDVVSAATVTPRFTMFLFLLFAVLAMVLATMGVYGIVVSSVQRQVHDHGIRMALGAAPMQLVWRTVGSGLILVGVGIVLGSALTILSSRLLSGFLHEISARDPITYLAAVLWLGIVGLVASYLPARKITRLDPAVTLRSE